MTEPFCANPKCHLHNLPVEQGTQSVKETAQTTTARWRGPRDTKTIHRELFACLQDDKTTLSRYFCPTCGEAARMTASMMRGRP